MFVSSPTPQSSTIGYSSSVDDLNAAHNAAWERFNAAEAELKAHPGSMPAMREYDAACKNLQYVRNLFFVSGLGR